MRDVESPISLPPHSLHAGVAAEVHDAVDRGAFVAPAGGRGSSAAAADFSGR